MHKRATAQNRDARKLPCGEQIWSCELVRCAAVARAASHSARMAKHRTARDSASHSTCQDIIAQRKPEREHLYIPQHMPAQHRTAQDCENRRVGSSMPGSALGSEGAASACADAEPPSCSNALCEIASAIASACSASSSSPS
eukprot:1567126-Rhodomonas_salina.1